VTETAKKQQIRCQNRVCRIAAAADVWILTNARNERVEVVGLALALASGVV
jgi:hypothetical protein